MQGENWQELAMSWLGAADDMARNELLAHASKGVPWVPPVEGGEIEIPRSSRTSPAKRSNQRRLALGQQAASGNQRYNGRRGD